MADEFRAALPRVASGVLMRDPEGRVLLVKPTYKAGWDLPGGYVEPGESPKAAALRELDEELGITPVIGRLLVVDWAPRGGEGDKLLFVFEAAFVALAALTKDGVEIGDLAYVAPADLGAHLSERLLTRVLSAVDDDPDVYREHGRSTSSK